MTVEITGFDWVPDFAKGFVRDLRPRWACAEIGLPYSMRLLNAAAPRPEAYFQEQPWGQVPALVDPDHGVRMFESGAILLHLGEKDERLLPRDPQGRVTAISWLFAAYNSVEPLTFELSNIEIFAAGEKWAELRRPSLIEFAGQRLDRLATAIEGREWLAGRFSIADIAMATVLRNVEGSGLIEERPVLMAYLERAIDRPAFKAALAAQLADFKPAPAAAA
ncbi:glutathione S-transferase family protein [Sphingomonas sp. BT-65]|uniref:glutathione S-transferase family protein n=1 Tax=Sphingomonas sp. BT-65 TaxID=2989821 RepID=UPI0022360CD5|nr:glutathione S-transferase family protein [Sphingomonas sp. BT-65]MCW4461532.1 glutathione S-transferase family protein [Sphingomonas sp. BT-65]